MKSLKLILALTFLLPTLMSQAQQQEVMEVVQSVFTGMAADNGAMVEKAFTEDAVMYTIIVDDQGKVQKRQGSLAGFVERVNGEKEQPYSEPIWNEKVQIDGPLASVWVDYAFYLGKDFHHCGVDAFHLMETENGWKIFHIVDTRRTDDCDVPKKISSKYK